MITFEKVTSKNLHTARATHKRIFYKTDAEQDFTASINKDAYYKDIIYWLVKDRGVYVGIIGLYCCKKHTKYNSAWIGWFGILKRFRAQGYAKKAFNFFERQAKKKGYKYIRVYTDKTAYKTAVKFYTKQNMLSEEYLKKKNILIFSKSITGSKITLWNNKDLAV